MKKSKIVSISISLLSVFVLSCTSVAITGRKQFAIIPSSQILPMSFSNYETVLKTSKLSTNKKQTELVKRVGKRIQNAVESYFAKENMSAQLSAFRWEFNLIDEAIANAWCMPGGKVAFYTGILPICKDENGVAVVMGHEIAHAIANHGNERMSQGLLQQVGSLALSEALKNKPEETKSLYMTAYGVGSNLLAVLPFSRLHESEADKMGLIFMAIAGYDPHQAPEFWKRMAAQNKGKEPPQFLSTHPSNQTRIDDLNAAIPEAMSYYRKK